MRNRKRVSFQRVTMKDAFWLPRIENHGKTLRDNLDKCQSTGRIDNFAKAAGKMEGDFQGIYFNDSDVYKVIEGVAYYLQIHEDVDLERRTDGIIELIAAAQQDDGYLNTYYTLAEPGKHLTDMSMHELYCAGHLIEAAVAYSQATGKDALLGVARKYADFLDNTFRVAGRHWVTGHQEIELALIRLSNATGEERYLKLARYLMDQRGRNYGKGRNYGQENWGARYCQDDRRCEDLRDVSGHAVRAMYLYAAMAYYETAADEDVYDTALDSLWDSVVNRNLYLTGGIGSTKMNEGFTEDYDLPNDSAYCETCAAAGLVFWASRMGVLRGEAKYYDVLERALYNGALAGISLSGDRYFYENPLSSDGSHHRQEWFDCSCCPTQLARFIPSVGGYLYAREGTDTVMVNLYAQSHAEFPIGNQTVAIDVDTQYPWNGDVKVKLTGGKGDMRLKLRVPNWCPSIRLRVDGVDVRPRMENGYAVVEQANKAGEIILQLDMPVMKVRADVRVLQNRGKTALQRGPLVYCVEEADNPRYNDLSIAPNDAVSCEPMPDLLGGIVALTVNRPGLPSIRAIPYYAWDNRAPGKMDVWLPLRRAEVGLYF